MPASRCQPSVGLYLYRWASGSYTYCYTGDMNERWCEWRLCFISQNEGRTNFADKKDKENVIFTAVQQADAFWELNQIRTWEKHKGEYAEAFSAHIPGTLFRPAQPAKLRCQSRSANNTLQLTSGYPEYRQPAQQCMGDFRSRLPNLWLVVAF